VSFKADQAAGQVRKTGADEKLHAEAGRVSFIRSKLKSERKRLDIR
jgi:hypothetical protein